MSLASRLGNRFKAEFASRVITVVSGGILTVALARLLDPDGYGLLFLAISIITVVKTFSIVGVPKSGAKYISQYKETNPDQVPYIVRFTLTLTMTLTVLMCGIVLLSYENISSLIGEPKLTSLLIIGVAFIFFGSLTSVLEGILLGFEAIESKAIIHAVNHAARLPFALGLVILGYGAIGALTGYVLASVLASLIGLPYLYSKYYHNQSQEEREHALYRRVTEYAIPITVTQASKVLDKRVDIILIGFFLNPTAVAFYTISRQIVSFIQTPIGALGTTLGPTFQAQKAKGNPKMVARMYEEALSHGLLLYVSAAAGLILVAEPTVELIFGTQYLGAVPVLQILAIWAVLRSVMAITNDALDFLGRARDRAIVYGIAAILNMILNIILIPMIGVIGAAIATVTTYSIYTILSVYLIMIELDLRNNWMLKKLSNALIIAFIMSSIVYFLIETINSISTLFGVVGVGVVIWLTLAIFFGYLDVRRIFSILS